jgi:hypothetical protein
MIRKLKTALPELQMKCQDCKITMKNGYFDHGYFRWLYKYIIFT